MPITGWNCSVCKRNDLPLDHYATTECGLSVPADYCEAIVAAGREHHERGVVVTNLLGCPRSAAIEADENLSVDPLDYNARNTGKAWHSFLEKATVDPDNTEVRVKGVIDGVAIRGKIDRLIPQFKVICDHKHRSDWAAKYDTGAKPEHIAQLSLYAELCEQSKGWRPERAIVWYHYSQGGSKAFKPIKAELLTLEATLAVRPYGGKFTVRELLQQAHRFFGGEVTWEQLPLAGESQMFGTKEACQWCSVRSICWTAERGAPW